MIWKRCEDFYLDVNWWHIYCYHRLIQKVVEVHIVSYLPDYVSFWFLLSRVSSHVVIFRFAEDINDKSRFLNFQKKKLIYCFKQASFLKFKYIVAFVLRLRLQCLFIWGLQFLIGNLNVFCFQFSLKNLCFLPTYVFGIYFFLKFNFTRLGFIFWKYLYLKYYVMFIIKNSIWLKKKITITRF